jgi:hypothetical protein
MLLHALAVVAFSLPLFAQDYRGAISGQVQDQQGAAIPAAKVIAVNKATQVATEGVSNELGRYRIPFLVPGDYEVSAEAPGFRRALRQDVRLSVNASLQLDFNLEVGQISESVTVSGEAPPLNTTNAELGQVIDKEIINVLNVSLTRNVTNLVQLAPGVTGGTGTYTSLAQNGFSINGGGGVRAGNEFLVDGIPSTLPTSGGLIAFTPALDTVAEVKVQTTLFDAQYGRSNGGALNVTTKGGSNDFHGAAYWFKRWAALNANSWNNNRLGLPRPPVTYDQYGYYVSGPVLIPKLFSGRNKLFFSTNLEMDKDPRELTRQARTPTSLEKQGDFSQTLNQQGGVLNIFDPATTVISGNTARRTPFAGNRIPANRIDPTGQAVLNAIESPNDLQGQPRIGAFNWRRTGTYTVTQKNLNARVDLALSDRQRLFGRFGRMWRSQDSNNFGFPGVFSFPPVGTTDLGLNNRWFTSAAFDDTITFSPSLVGSFRLGLSRYLSRVTNGGVNMDPAQLKVASQIIQNQAVRGFPTFNFLGTENVPSIGSSFSTSADDQYSFLASFSKIYGKHTWKFGSDYRLVRRNNRNPGGAAPGQFHFGSLFTREDPFNPRSGDTTGTAMASLLLGVPESGSLGFNSALSVQNHYAALFFQDDWRLTRKLTLNLGMRWELETPFTERYNRTSYGFDETVAAPVQVPGLNLRGGLLFVGDGSTPRRQGVVDANNFGPRIGFAYQITPKTVIRGGYGVFFAGQNVNSGFLGAVNTFNAVTPYVATIDAATPFTTLANPFPGGLQQPLGSSPGLRAGLGDSIEFWDTRRVSPYNQQWQFSVQRELPWRAVADIAWAGMHAVKQFESFNLNERHDSALPLGNTLNQTVPNPFRGVLPANSQLGQGANITRERLLVRFPQYNIVNIHGNNTGRGLYHSLQVNVNKRLSNGLTTTFIYTFSRLMDNNTTSIVNPRSYRAVSEFDQKHLSRIALTYDLPWRFSGTSAASKFARHTIGGWKIASLITFATGAPLTVTHPNGRPLRIRNARLEGPVVDRLGDRREGTRVVNPYFDTGAFQAFLTPFVVTPEPPRLDELRAPGTSTMNLNLFKSIAIWERVKLELRMESSSFTNTPNFNAPATALNNLATFGVINGAGGSRNMQGALRIVF